MAILQLGHKGPNAGFAGALVVGFVNGVIGNQIDMALKAPQMLRQFLQRFEDGR
jgi:fructose-specific phosphotransferase system IIC component